MNKYYIESPNFHKTTTKGRVQKINKKDSLIAIPTSPLTHLTGQGLITSAEKDQEKIISRLQTQKAISGYHKDIDIKPVSGGFEITYKEEDSVSKLTLETGIGKKASKNAYKFFKTFLALVNNSPNERTALIPAKDLAKTMGYSRTSTLNRAFDNVASSLRKMGADYQSKNKKTGKIKATVSVPYFSLLARTDDNNYDIRLNPDIDIPAIFKYWTVYKPFAFRLKENAFILYDNIMFLARQNKNKIQDLEIREGKTQKCLKFNINLRTVAFYLSLPVDDFKKGATQIKAPINDAIGEIESYDNEMYLTVMGGDNNSIEDYLANGYIEVILTGSYIEYFEPINTAQVKQIEKSVKRKEKAMQKVLEKQEEKKLDIKD